MIISIWSLIVKPKTRVAIMQIIPLVDKLESGIIWVEPEAMIDTYSQVAPGIQEAAAKRFDEIIKQKSSLVDTNL